MNVREFRQIQRTHEHGSFGAFEYAFTKFESLENVEPAIVYSNNHQYEFLINDVNRTALYKKCVMRKGKIFYIFKCFLFCVCIFYFYFFLFLFSDHRSPMYHHDFCDRVVTIDTTVRALRAFFSRYNGYKLAVALGNFFFNFL